MQEPIDFYFDFSSPYGYFAAMRIEALAEKYAREVNWHAILLGAVFQVTGSTPLTLVPMKGNYSLHDFERSARFHGIEFKLPGTFPLSTQVAARALLWLQNRQDTARAVAFAKAVYRAYFVDDIDIGNSANVAKIAAGLGLDAAALLEDIQSPEIKAQLKGEVDKAIACGVFGAPFIIVDGESFWGFDRFDQLEALLKNGKI